MVYCSWTVCLHNCPIKGMRLHGGCNHPNGAEKMVKKGKIKTTEDGSMTNCKLYSSKKN